MLVLKNSHTAWVNVECLIASYRASLPGGLLSDPAAQTISEEEEEEQGEEDDDAGEIVHEDQFNLTIESP